MDKVKEFLIKVKELNKKYDLDLFCVTEGNSIYNMKHGTEAVKLARSNHIKWELENGFNPNEEWGSNNE